MSEDEMEKFEITDYDLENEFNINRNRGRKKNSKHHQIYGNKTNQSFHYIFLVFSEFKRNRMVKRV